MLDGRTAIVTGGGQGVGRGIALALAKAGAKIALAGRTLDKLEAVAREIVAAGGEARAFACNVKDAASIEALVEGVVAAFGGVDILVNNAQEVALGTILSVSDADFEASFDSGPLAALRLMRLCHPHLKASGHGVVVNLTTSATRRWDMAGFGHYGAVKRATESLTRAAAAEWGEDNIRVLAVAPHADSPGLKWWIEHNPEEAAAFFKTIPLRRIGRCEEDIGAAVAALCGPAFGYVTGAVIPLDGGQANFA